MWVFSRYELEPLVWITYDGNGRPVPAICCPCRQGSFLLCNCRTALMTSARHLLPLGCQVMPSPGISMNFWGKSWKIREYFRKIGCFTHTKKVSIHVLLLWSTSTNSRSQAELQGFSGQDQPLGDAVVQADRKLRWSALKICWHFFLGLKCLYRPRDYVSIMTIWLLLMNAYV